METVKIATINMNGISTRTKAGMFEDSIQDLDILLVQEVTSPEIANMHCYMTNLNTGTTMRTIVGRSAIQLTNITATRVTLIISVEFSRR